MTRFGKAVVLSRINYKLNRHLHLFQSHVKLLRLRQWHARVDLAVHDLLLSRPVLQDVSDHPWMLRVIDLPAAVAARGWPLTDLMRPLAVDIEVVDEHAPWQAGRHRIVFDGGSVFCEPGGTGAVRLHARALGPWYAGSADTPMLRRAGLLEGDHKIATQLDALTGAPRPVRIADAF